MPTDLNANPAPARILLADDDPRLLDSVRRLLELYQHEVVIAAGGAEAIEELRTGHYDLLLLDLRMPRVSGHDVMEYMAKGGIDTMTIVVSGESSLDDMARALRRGAYDYLKKPYAPEELLATVNNALRKKQLEDRNQQMRNQLDRSEKLHRFIVNNSPDIIFILDEDGNFSFLNAKVETLLGYSRAELLGRHITSIVDPEDREKASYFFDRPWHSSDTLRSMDLTLKPRDPSISKRHFELALWPVHENDEFNGQSQRYRVYGTARDITDRKEAEAFVSFHAYHDLLTRLPNRSLFKDRLSMAIANASRSKARPAVMFIDLDRFKVINDSLGHTMGDRLLQAVARRLSGCIRQGDTLSRFGGDEFTLLLPDVQDPQLAVNVAEKVLEHLKQPFHLDGHDLYVGASIGIAVYPEGGTTIDAIIKNADIAMYRVKNTGRDGYQIFNREMNAGMTQRLALEQDMRRALESNQFKIYYQPQVDTNTAELLGVEALLRWQHPTLGELQPSTFIPIAEDSRLIVELDRITLQRACRQIGSLQRHGWPKLRLSVNLSPLLMERGDFVDVVLGTLEKEGLEPERLELEITEGLLMNDRQEVIDKLRRLHAAGINIAIDDFGTGYSSLGYLQKLPVTTLKIDRSFIHDINSVEETCIVNAIVAMAQGLKLRVVAEGVERESQLHYLRAIQCPVAQGYLFGKARPLGEVLARYQRQNAAMV